MNHPASPSLFRPSRGAFILGCRSYLIVAALAAGICSLQARSAEADTPATEESTATLKPVKVTASAERPTREVSMETVQRTQAKDMKELFANEPSVSVGGATRAAQRLYFRNLEATQLNVTIDGATQGRPLFQHRGDVAGLDPELIKRVEIQTAGTSDQGVGALGGSIRFETLDAQDLLEGGERFGGSAKASYSSAASSPRGSLSLFGRATENLGLLAHVSAENADEYKSGNGDHIHGTGSNVRDYFFKLSFLDKNGHSLRASAERNKDWGDYVFKADAQYSPTAETQFSVGERNTYVLDYRYKPEGSKVADFRANLYSNKRQLSWIASGSQIFDKDLGGEIRNTFSFDLGPTRHRLTVGLDYVDGKGAYAVPAGKIGLTGDIETENQGYFIQERMTVGRLGLSLGGRLDRYETYYGATAFKGHEFSPSGRIDYTLGGGWSAYAAYSEAVRSTSCVPIAWFAYVITPTPAFNRNAAKDSYGKPFVPESSKQREAGLVYESRSLLATDDVFTAQATVFRTRLLNLVQQTNDRSPTRINGFYNDDPLTSEGYELKAAWQRQAWRTSLSFIHATLEDDNGNPFALTRRIGGPLGDRFNWDLRWQAASNLSLGYTLNAVDGLDNVTRPLPGFVTHSLQAQWQPTQVKGLALSLVVNNLFDRQYSDQASMPVGEPEPGRDVRMSVGYRF